MCKPKGVGRMLSMTGYGRAFVEIEGRQMTVEVKSVNHRFLDIAFRMPRNCDSFMCCLPPSIFTRVSLVISTLHSCSRATISV